MKGTKIKGIKNRILAGVLLVIMLALTVLPLMPVKARGGRGNGAEGRGT